MQKSSTSEQLKSGTKQNLNDMRKKKDEFFSSMIPDPRPISTESEDDLEVLGSVDANDFIFNPLTVPVRKAIYLRLNMPFRKEHLNHENIGEELSDRNPRVKSILGDSNCLFHALSVAMTGWETSHLAFRQLICEHILEMAPHTNNNPSKYLNNMKMRSLKVFGTDVEIMAAAQIIECNIYVYHTYGNCLKWLRFPCVHSSCVGSNAIYLDNKTGNGKTAHFEYVCGLF